MKNPVGIVILNMICKKSSAGIGAMRRIVFFFPIDTLGKVYNSLVQSYFENCSPLWDNWENY